MNCGQKAKNNKTVFVTGNASQTRKLGELLAKELRGGEVICLAGELGSGKTTFAQGVLRGLGANGPYTSPTFLVMKHYKIKITNQNLEFENIYHIDCYRVKAQDILALGWKEITSGKNNIVIVEWAERIRRIIPEDAIWIGFEHWRDNKRKISIK